jgi:hypothetical protein
MMAAGVVSRYCDRAGAEFANVVIRGSGGQKTIQARALTEAQLETLRI